MKAFLLPAVMLMLGCAPAKQEPEQAKPTPDYFERKLQCFQAAEAVAKERFTKNDLSGFTQVVYSPKRQSCVVATTLIAKKFITYRVEDLLTYETIWNKTCTIGRDCGPEVTTEEMAEVDKLR